MTLPACSPARSPTCGSSRVDDEGRALGQLPHRRAPALGDLLELAVAVELVAEEVAEADRARAAAGARRPATRPRRPRTGRARRRAASSRVEATPETRLAPELLCASRSRGREDLRDHRGGRRLAVRRRDDRRPQRQPAGESRDRTRIDRRQQLPGQCRAAAPARQAREAAGRARDGELQGEAHRGQSSRAGSIPRTRDLSRFRPMRTPLGGGSRPEGGVACAV